MMSNIFLLYKWLRILFFILIFIFSSANDQLYFKTSLQDIDQDKL